MVIEGWKKSSEIGASVQNTPFGTLEELRKEVASVLDEVSQLGRLPV